MCHTPCSAVTHAVTSCVSIGVRLLNDHILSSPSLALKECRFYGSSQQEHDVMQVAAGSTSSFCTCTGGMLFGWGKLKSSGDNWRAPPTRPGSLPLTFRITRTGSQATAVSCPAAARLRRNACLGLLWVYAIVRADLELTM